MSGSRKFIEWPQFLTPASNQFIPVLSSAQLCLWLPSFACDLFLQPLATVSCSNSTSLLYGQSSPQKLFNGGRGEGEGPEHFLGREGARRLLCGGGEGVVLFRRNATNKHRAWGSSVACPPPLHFAGRGGVSCPFSRRLICSIIDLLTTLIDWLFTLASFAVYPAVFRAWQPCIKWYIGMF